MTKIMTAYFDPEGIHLFRYNEEENGYLALLTHEIVHAVREPYYIEQDPYRWPNFGYFDEGFAGAITQAFRDRTSWYSYCKQ